MLRAMLKANGYILKNRDGTIQVLVSWAKSKPEFAEASYDSAVSAFSADGSIPEDGMRVVMDGLRKSMNIARQVPLSEVCGLGAAARSAARTGIEEVEKNRNGSKLSGV